MLRKEKDELKERVAQYESSFLGRAARWLNQNDPGKQKPGKLQKEARSAQHSENRLTENHREHRSAEKPSLEVVPVQPASNRATPEKDTLITPAMVTRTPLNQEDKREALVDKAWHRYLQRLRRLNPHRWVMILSSPTYFRPVSIAGPCNWLRPFRPNSYRWCLSVRNTAQSHPLFLLIQAPPRLSFPRSV